MSKILAVFGSPGSGKSIFSVALATQLAKKSNVVLLSTDRLVPMLKVLVPSAQIDRSLSVGGLFTGTGMTQEDICKRMVFHPQSANLGFMAFATGDTPNTYSGGFDAGGYRSIFTADKLQSFFSILLNLTDYLLVDCMGNITSANDPLGSVALTNSDCSIKLLSPSIAGIEYDTAMMPLLREDTETKKTLTAFGRVAPGLHPVQEVQGVLKQQIEYSLCESAEMADFFLSGQLLSKAKTKEGHAYLSETKRIKEAIDTL